MPTFTAAKAKVKLNRWLRTNHSCRVSRVLKVTTIKHEFQFDVEVTEHTGRYRYLVSPSNVSAVGSIP